MVGEIERRYQVFISSTYVDLIEERQQVVQVLLELECIPAGMELFTAANAEQWELIKDVIDRSDYYVVVVGGRYGTTDDAGLSYTEREFDYAVEAGIPVLAFVHAAPGTIARDKTEVDVDAAARLDAFRAKVMTNRVVKKYTSADDLGSHVSRAVSLAMRKTPRLGYVRGDLAMTSEVSVELADLRARVAELQLDRSTSRTVPEGSEDLAQGSDPANFKIQAYGRETDDDGAATGPAKWWWYDSQVTWDELLHEVGPALLGEIDQDALGVLLNKYAERFFYRDERSEEVRSDLVSVNHIRAGDESADDVLVQFLALGLIERGKKNRPPSDRDTYWVLTSHGADRLMSLRAQRKGEPEDGTPF